MKEIVILSGKGGTGKTTLTLNLFKITENSCAADVDVDASDMFIMLSPVVEKEIEFRDRETAIINSEKCSLCGTCASLCRFNAISRRENEYFINPVSCEGCGLCFYACPEKAIIMKNSLLGKIFISSTEYGNFTHARLVPGAENSGGLVTEVKKLAHRRIKDERYLFVDGPPGIGCPTISALNGADFVVIVTEPTLSGMHDLERLASLIEKMKIKSGVVINKADLNMDISYEIEKYCQDKGILLLEKINFDMRIIEALNNKVFACDVVPEFKAKTEIIFKKIVEFAGD